MNDVDNWKIEKYKNIIILVLSRKFHCQGRTLREKCIVKSRESVKVQKKKIQGDSRREERKGESTLEIQILCFLSTFNFVKKKLFLKKSKKRFFVLLLLFFHFFVVDMGDSDASLRVLLLERELYVFVSLWVL